MNKYFKIALLCIPLGFVTNCSQVLQTIELKVDSEDNSVQQEFNVLEKTLTIKIFIKTPIIYSLLFNR